MAIIDSATVSSIGSVAKTIVSAPGFATAASEIFKVISTEKLPLANPLSSYATFNYVVSIGVLTDAQLNSPDGSYMSGDRIPLICKTAGADPNNRVNTAYGKFDFYVDDIVIESQIGFMQNKNTNVSTIAFTVYEPYSLGLFMLSVQQAAYEAGHANWREAPFLLSIAFQGNLQNGTMINVPNTTRHIPFRWTDVHIKTSEKGTVYTCTAMPVTMFAQTEDNAKFKSDVSVKGRTVQEVLQTGEKSLQAVVNARLKQLKEDKAVEVPDEVIIMFPVDVSSASGGGESDSGGTATASTQSSSEIYKKLGVVRDEATNNLVQPQEQCNALGLVSMGFGPNKKADAPVNKENVVYNADKKIWDQTANTTDETEGNLKFSQDIDIPTAINQVMILSEYPAKALGKDAVDQNGMRPWWRIDTQVYTISTDANMGKTGTKPRLIVYRVVPYDAHTSTMAAPNTKAPGFDNLKTQAVKVYDYIYTGKNTEVLKFDIDFSIAFTNVMAADNFKRSQDVVLKSFFGSVIDFLDIGGLIDGVTNAVGGALGGALGNAVGGALGGLVGSIESLFTGNSPSKELGVTPTQVKYTATDTTLDGLGGGGLETAYNRAAKVFQDALTNTNDMIELNLEILGDPFWIAQSGQGNYTSKQTQYKDLNADGTVNYQNGEVDILVNFRSPVDINQATGMYNFGSNSDTAPVIQFSGLYRVTTVKSTFAKGRFTQTVSGQRRPQQENPTEGTVDQLFNVDSLLSSAGKAVGLL